MIATTKKLEAHTKEHRMAFDALNRKYWELLNKHERLLSYLGIIEVEIKAGTELRKKEDKEK